MALPPGIDVYGTDDMEQMVAAIQNGAMAVHDYLDAQAGALDYLILDLLRSEGLDGPGTFRWSDSTAAQAAKRVTGPMRRTRDDFETAAKRIQVVNRAWHTHVVAPVHKARAERSRTRTKLNV